MIERIKVIDAHTGGEPLRLIVGGLPPLQGNSILEKRRYLLENHDRYRTALMWEPRGHADMYGCILTEPETQDGDYGVLFLHNEGYSTMCGHGIIALATLLIECDIAPGTGEERVFQFDTPAGRVTATAQVSSGRVEKVSFLNVPSYVAAQGVQAAGGKFDIAYGGAYYAIGSSRPFGMDIETQFAGEWIRLGKAIKTQVAREHHIEHPEQPDLGFLYGTIFVGDAHQSSRHSRNVCVFADGEVDRSPTGTGVSARAAIHYFAGELGLGEPIEIESIVDSVFEVEAVREVQFGPHRAIIPKVSGRAFVTGESEFYLDPQDPMRDGFLIR